MENLHNRIHIKTVKSDKTETMYKIQKIQHSRDSNRLLNLIVLLLKIKLFFKKTNFLFTEIL